MSWISVKERLPTAQDADEWKCVLIWHRYNGVMVKGWHQIRKDDPYITHWMRMPERPEEGKTD